MNRIFFIVLTVASMLLIYQKRDSANLLIYIMLGISAIYLSWALIYHKIDKSLTLPIFIEYLLTAVLVLILLMGVLL